MSTEGAFDPLELRRTHAGGQAAGAEAGVDVRSDPDAVAFLQQNQAVAATVNAGTILVRPEARDSRAVLAHEYAHIAQLRSGIAASRESAERAADDASAGALHERGGAPAPPLFQTQTMSRADFEATVRRRFGVTDVHTGTLAEQQTEITRYGVTPKPGLTAAMWQSWDPGAASELYREIVDAILALGTSFGGIPVIRRIVFYDMSYELDASGVAHALPDVGADYGGGILRIFRRGAAADMTARAGVPFARSVKNANYPGAPVIVMGGTGVSPGAPIGLPTQRQGAMRVIEHELGHGLAEAAMTPRAGAPAVDPGMVADYGRAVGWFGTPGAERLYDIGAPGVQAAISAGTPPPATAEITVNNWNDPKWVEQPISAYSVLGKPPEDFAEAVMAYVDNPALLRARSPHRFAFLDARKSRWQPQLVQPRP